MLNTCSNPLKEGVSSYMVVSGAKERQTKVADFEKEINYVIGCRQDKQTAYRFLAADFFAKIVCLICFVAFPTTNTRPDIAVTSVWDAVLRYTYCTAARSLTMSGALPF